MKETNNNKNFFKGFKLYTDVYKAGSMISLANAKHLQLVLKNVGWRLATLTLLSTREVSRFTLIHNFGVYLLRLYKRHGSTYVVKFLKASQLALQKKIAGQPLSSLREIEPDYPLPRLSKSGLPLCIKENDRSSICVGSVRIIRFWLSIFSLYRVLETEFKPKLNTITDPFVGNESELLRFNE
jgi:hypothetical protein